MEKIKETNFKSTIRRTKLFIDDIKEIISRMESIDLIVEIIDTENKYDSLEDLIDNKGENPKLIKLTGHMKKLSTDFINISISDLGTSIYINGNPEMISLGYELERFLIDRRVKRLHSFFNAKYAKIQLLLNGILVLLFWIFSKYQGPEFSHKFWSSYIIFWILILIYSELNPMTNSNIELLKKHEISFYKRNKDKILIGIIMAILGSLVTIIINV